MPTEKRKLGDVGEEIALGYLKRAGYVILEKNYQKPWGEIDIIAKRSEDKKNDGIIFIEVKTKRNIGEYFPEENVNTKKQQKIIRTAQTYLAEKQYPSKITWQIDVIAVELNEQKRKANLKHIKNAVWQ